jgi:hypothetical protein
MAPRTRAAARQLLWEGSLARSAPLAANLIETMRVYNSNCWGSPPSDRRHFSSAAGAPALRTPCGDPPPLPPAPDPRPSCGSVASL